MTEMNERELLNAILYELKAVRAKVDTASDDLLHLRKEMTDFKQEVSGFKQEMSEFNQEMYAFRKETANNFNQVNRRLRFGETDYDQLNKRVDNLEVGSSL